MIPVGSFSRRFLFALPVTLAALLVVAATQSVEHGAALMLVVLAASLAGPRLRVSDESQHVAAGVALVPAMLITLPFTQELPGVSRLAGAWAVVATWAVLASASRLLMADPAWGARALLGFGSIAVLLAGYARLTTAYVGLSWAFVVACLGAVRVCDPARPSLRRLSAREWAVAGAVVLGTLSLSATSARGLPWLHEYLVAKYAHLGEDPSSSGFTPWLELGAMQSMTLSDELVMRVHGRAPAYLRGTAYDRYDRGRWRNSHAPAVTVVRTGDGAVEGPDAVRVERVGGLPGWYFLPLEARAVSTRTGSVRRDAIGTVRAIPGDEATVVWYRVGARDTLRPVGPTEVDREVPAPLRPTLDRFVAQWTAGLADDGARMDALRRHLRREYRYALRFERARGVDPVVDFLTVHREGHCEYFASTLALLGRAAGVPTRVVGGYRVAERNPFDGYYMVREKNAHAWVEAWVHGAWTTLDATPAGAIPYNERHDASWARAAGEFLTQRVRRAQAWVAGAGANVMLALAAGLLVVWLLWRAWRLRGGAQGEGEGARAAMQALPCLDALTAALTAAGVARDGAETLARFASRVEASELPEAVRVEAAGALRRYAALRYGAEGDEADVARAMLRAAERVTGGARA